MAKIKFNPEEQLNSFQIQELIKLLLKDKEFDEETIPNNIKKQFKNK